MKSILRLGSRDSEPRSSLRLIKKNKVLKKDGYTLLYLGHTQVGNPKSLEEILSVVIRIKQHPTSQIPVQLTCRGQELQVMEGDRSVLHSFLLDIGQCVQSTSKDGFSDCLAISVLSGPLALQCHVFQAKSTKEASEIAHSVQKCIKTAIKNQRRRTEIPSGMLDMTDRGRVTPSPRLGSESRVGLRRKSDAGIQTVRAGDDSPYSPKTTRSNSTASLGNIIRVSPGPRAWRRRRGDGREKDFNRAEKLDQVHIAWEEINESNVALRVACSNPHPQSPFEQSLHAINYSSETLLSILLSQQRPGTDSFDHNFNTLMHYAVAMQKVDAIRVLHEKQCSIEHPNISGVHPLHRAVVGGGDKLVLVSLLERRANVNSEDGYKNTPLHYAACQRDQNEACWILLQYGAMVNRPNALGIRPIDLLPDLKEMQNRLIISVCKNFSDPPERSVSPAPSLSPPSSTCNDTYGLGENILEQLGNKTKSIRSKGRKHRMRKHSSISNLSELLEADEDEMYRQDRQKRLQFPFEQKDNPDFLKLYHQKDVVETGLNKLIAHGKSAKRTNLKRSSSDPELASHEGQTQNQTSEKFLSVLRMWQKDQPASKPPKPHKVRPALLNSGLAAKFDHLLQTELDMASSSNTPEIRLKKEEVVKISPRMQHKNILKMSSSPIPAQKKQNNRLAVLDDYISQMLSYAGELDDILPQRTGCNGPQKAEEEASSTNTTSDHTLVKSDTEQQHEGGVSVNQRKHSITSPVRIEVHESEFSSESKRRHSLQEAKKRGHLRTLSHGSSYSVTPSSSLSSLLHYSSHNGSLMGLPIDMDSSEPGAQSLHILVLLSKNPECAQNLISHICLSDFKEKLIATATSPQSSDTLLTWIASLVTNILECGGSEGRTTAIESGMMDIIVKLLPTRDPIPGTCLNLLNSLLVSGDDNDYLKTIVKIPCEPLLVFLEPCESDVDSGLGRDPSLSSATASDHQMSSNADDSSGRSTLLPLTKERGFSITSESSSGGHSAASPTLQGNIITRAEARRIVLKMLAQSSVHNKVKNSLSQLRTIALLMDYLSDPSQENILNALKTLANIAQIVSTHPLFIEIGIIEKLRELIVKGPRIRFHALRILVYIGKIQLSGISLFDCLDQEPDSVIMATDQAGHEYARGVTLERMVNLVATSPRALWGGLTLWGTSSGHRISRDKTMEFILTTYQSFMDPLIFIRLLMHRLDVSDFTPNPFDWSQDLNNIHHAHINDISPIHQSVLHLMGHWMEIFPEDFKNHSEVKDAVTDVIHRLKKFRGVYTPHLHKLQSLLKEIQRPSRRRKDSVTPSADRALRLPHHENLYTQCKQLVSEDLLPVTMETAIYLCGLQLHIETLADNALNQAFMEGGVKGKKESRVFLTHLKHALPAWCFRGKNIGKRVREKLSDFEGLSERNAKHMYIDRCLNTPGYNSTFYSVKVPTGGKFRRGTTAQLFGIGDQKLLFLDEKTREVTGNYNLKDIVSVRHSPSDNCTINIKMKDGFKLQLHVEKEGTARQIEMIMDNLDQKALDDIEKEDIDDFMTNWGHSPSSLQMSAGQGEGSHSSPSSPDPHISKEFEDTIIPLIKEEDNDLNTPTTVKANGTPLVPITPLETSIQQQPQEGLFVFPVGVQFTEDHPVFCDCPPDPEIPLRIDVRLLSLQEILRHPIEVARQVTLIEHERLYSISREELMQRAGLLPKPKTAVISSSPSPAHCQKNTILATSSEEVGGIKRLAGTFNQLSKWVVHSILQYTQEEDRGWVIQQFIITAHHCLTYRNFSSTMAIVSGVTAPPIKRLERTWEHVSKPCKDQLAYLKELSDYRNNFKCYRELIEKTKTPAVPFFGIFTKDLTFIADGNPDYLRNTINLHKRRQLFAKIEEIRYFQSDRYNFEPVVPLQTIITNHVPLQDDDFYSLSESLEPPAHPHAHSYLEGSGRNRSASISSLTTLGFLRHSFNVVKTSGSNTNLLSV